MNSHSTASLDREQQRHHWAAVATHERRRVRRWVLFAFAVIVAGGALVFYAFASIGE